MGNQVGDTYQITITKEMSEQSSTGGSGTSRDKDTMFERITGMRADGLEVEYSLPPSASKNDQIMNWQLPVRMFKPHQGAMQLLNAGELETRLGIWLKTAGFSREMCGHWIFTWNAFRIECDPQSVITLIQKIDLSSADLRDGAVYEDADARAPGILIKAITESGQASFKVVLEADPEVVRRASAESDVVVRQLMREPITLEEALREHQKEKISGTISINFEADSHESTLKRIKVTQLKIESPDGQTQSRTLKETTERRLISGQAAPVKGD